MSYFEVVREHEYIDEYLGLEVEAENDNEAEEILRNNGYTVLRVVGEVGRIYVR